MMLRVQPPTADLMTDPGVPEGQRHQKLCQLAGVHLARGESEEQVEALALAWGERCDPPMDEGEIEATVRSLANKHFANTTGIVDEESIDSIQLPQQDVAWPTLDEHALHGWLGDMVRLIAPETEADPVAILASALVCVGNCFGRKVWFPVEGDRHHANLFACLVGESSRGRKGTSLGRTLTLWAPGDPWRSQCMASGLSSGEGLKWAVRDRVEAIEPIKQKGHIIAYQTVIKDQGVEDKRLLVVESEFAQALKVAKREGNTLSPVIRQAWDTGTLRTLTRNDPTTATDAHVSILGHITMQELNKDMSENDFSNGFANRFLWLAVRRSQMLPDGGSDVDMTPLQVRLHEVLDQTSGVMGRSPAARDLWHQMYPALTADRPGLWGKVTSRGEAQTLRLSMIYALLDGSVTIEVPHLQAAFAVWEYAEASARLIFPEEEAMDPLEKSLMEKIKSSPGINRKQLHKALGGHVQAQAMVQALGKLATQGKARSEAIATGGRPSECWWPVEALQAGSTSTHKSTDVPVDDAKEQTESQRVQSGEDTPNHGRVKRRFDVQMLQPGEGLFDRSGATQSPFQDDQDAIDPISLTDLLNDVSALGGKIVRSEDGGFKVRGVDQQRLTSGILAALMKHHDELDLIVPTTSPTPEIGQSATVVQEQGEGWKPWEEFRAAVLNPKVEDDFLDEFFDRLNALPAIV
jgi:hypothetical protein